MSTQPEYRPFDREEKLGEPPWSPDDPKLIAWEKAHGHDVRLKCYPEFGCQALEAQRNRMEAAVAALLARLRQSEWIVCAEALRILDGTEAP